MSRWDRDRQYERERDRDNDRDDRSETTYRSDRDRDRRPGSPPRFRDRPDRPDRPEDRPEDRFPPSGPPPRGRAYDDDYVVRERERERQFYEDDRYSTPQPQPQPQQPRFAAPRWGPDGAPERRAEVLEREREQEFEARMPPPVRGRPQAMRRTSSFDGYDRRPINRLYEREQYGPPARREDYRPPPVQQAPLPRTRGLPPPERRTYEDVPYYDEIKIAEPDHYGDEEFHNFPERVHEHEREREVVRTTRRRRNRSRDSHTTATTATTRGRSRRSDSRSRSSASSSRSTSSSRSRTTARSEYPKKGKTRVPARLVSIRALIELGYPYIEQGNTVIIQKALGQANIDELLKLSEEYKKYELEISAARSSAGDYEGRHREIYAVPVPAALPAPPPPPPVQALSPIPVDKLPAAPTYVPPTPAPPPPPAVAGPPPPMTQHHAPSPYIVNAAPPPQPATVYRETEEYSTYHEHGNAYSPNPHAYSPNPNHHYQQQPHPYSSPVVYRDASPSRLTTTGTSYSSYSSYSPTVASPSHHAHHYTSATSGPVTVMRDSRDYYYPETSNEIPIGPGALTRPRSRSRSRSRRDIRHEIKSLEAELHGRKSHKHSHSHSNHGSSSELVKTERLSDGGIVLFEEKVETVDQGYKGARIERDKKGRMAISVPKYSYR